MCIRDRELTLQVVETPGPALFGRNRLSQIQLIWGVIKALKLQQKVDQLLQQYESVFFEVVVTRLI